MVEAQHKLKIPVEGFSKSPYRLRARRFISISTIFHVSFVQVERIALKKIYQLTLYIFSHFGFFPYNLFFIGAMLCSEKYILLPEVQIIVNHLKVTQWCLSGSIPLKFEYKLRRHYQRFGKITTKVVLSYSIFYRISNHKNFIQKYIDNALINFV